MTPNLPHQAYQLELKPSTTSGIAYLFLPPSSAPLAFAVFVPGLDRTPHIRQPTALFQTVSRIERQSTVGQFGNIFSLPYDDPSVADFQSTITGFYSKLLSAQEPLGREFEKVLCDNLWDLYVRS